MVQRLGYHGYSNGYNRLVLVVIKASGFYDTYTVWTLVHKELERHSSSIKLSYHVVSETSHFMTILSVKLSK